MLQVQLSMCYNIMVTKDIGCQSWCQFLVMDHFILRRREKNSALPVWSDMIFKITGHAYGHKYMHYAKLISALCTHDTRVFNHSGSVSVNRWLKIARRTDWLPLNWLLGSALRIKQKRAAPSVTADMGNEFSGGCLISRWSSYSHRRTAVTSGCIIINLYVSWGITAGWKSVWCFSQSHVD